jgi:hypothetical protein
MHQAKKMEPIDQAGGVTRVIVILEIDIVNGEVPEAIYQIKNGVANAVNARNIQFHGTGPGLNRPGTQINQRLVGSTGIFHSKGHRIQNNPSFREIQTIKHVLDFGHFGVLKRGEG